jgi:hypothetical protein
MYKPPLITNYEFLTRIYKDLQKQSTKPLSQHICDGLRHYLQQSKYYTRLTDVMLQTKTISLLSGNYDPDEPIDVFLYPPHDPYAYISPYTTIDALTTNLYIVSDPIQTLYRTLIIHDLPTDVYTAITDDGTIYTPTELSFLDCGEPITVKVDPAYIKDYLNSAGNSLRIDLTDVNHLELISRYNVILLNLDKLHDATIDTSSKPPVLSAIPVQDDPQEPAYGDVENPITDELLAELNKITDD